MKKIDFDLNLEKILDDASYEIDLKCITFFYLLLIPIILFLCNFIFNLECIILLIIGTISYFSMIYTDNQRKRNKRKRAKESLNILLEMLSNENIKTNVKQLTGSLMLKEGNIYPKKNLIVKENEVYFLDNEEKIQILKQIKTQLLSLKNIKQELYLLESEDISKDSLQVEVKDKKLVFKN